MDVLQLWYPEILHLGPKDKFCMFLRAEGYRNHPKHSQTSFWVQWTRMDASQLWYPEIVHSGPKHEFFIFDVPRVSEMLWNTSKHHFGSNGLEWMLHNFSTPEIGHLGPNTQVLQVFMCRRLAKSSEILANIILGTMDWNGCFTTLVPRNSAFRLEHKFCIFYVSKASEILWNTPKHHFGSNGLEWMLHNFGTTK
jgi:hypothetical protein